MKGYNRVGVFFVVEDINKNPFDYKNIFADLIVLHAERNMMRTKVKYYAACDQFDEIEEGFIIPEYAAIFKPGNYKPTWVKV